MNKGSGQERSQLQIFDPSVAGISASFRDSTITTSYKTRASPLNPFLLLYPSPALISNSSHRYFQSVPTFALSVPFSASTAVQATISSQLDNDGHYIL